MYAKTSRHLEDLPAKHAPIAPASETASVEALDAIWTRLKARLRAELGDDVFNSWFPRMEVIEAVDGVVHLSVPTKFLKSWVCSHYRDRLRRLFQEQNCGVEDVEIVVRVTGQKPSLGRVQRGPPPRPRRRRPVRSAPPAHPPPRPRPRPRPRRKASLPRRSTAG